MSASNYTGDSPIVSQGRATAAQIDALFREVAVERNQRVTTPPPGLGQAFVDGCRRYSPDVNHDHAAAQSAHETAGWTSFWASRNNPAGIGVTGQTGVGLTFETVESGIQAQVAHLLSYAVGVGEWTQDDPRASAMSRQMLGSAPTLHGLNGKWAVPGPVYGESIASLSNRLLTMDGGHVDEAQIPGFMWHPADRNHFDVGRRAAIRGGAQHYTAGSNSLNWLSTTSQPAVSATFLVKHDATVDDRGWQLVRIEDTAWTTAFANPYTVSIEYEHRAGQEISDAAYDALAQTWVDVTHYVREHGLGDLVEVKGHKEWVNNPSLVCPDGIDIEYIQLLWHERLDVVPSPPRPSDELILPANPFGPVPIVLGFRAYVEALGAARFPGDVNAGILSIFGYPMGAEHPLPGGGTQQEFERSVLIWTPDTDAPWDIVQALRSG